MTDKLMEVKLAPEAEENMKTMFFDSTKLCLEKECSELSTEQIRKIATVLSPFMVDTGVEFIRMGVQMVVDGQQVE